jgi:hypothetical protein
MTTLLEAARALLAHGEILHDGTCGACEARMDDLRAAVEAEERVPWAERQLRDPEVRASFDATAIPDPPEPGPPQPSQAFDFGARLRSREAAVGRLVRAVEKAVRDLDLEPPAIKRARLDLAAALEEVRRG